MQLMAAMNDKGHNADLNFEPGAQLRGFCQQLQLGQVMYSCIGQGQYFPTKYEKQQCLFKEL